MQKDVVEINFIIRLYYWDTFIKLFWQGWQRVIYRKWSFVTGYTTDIGKTFNLEKLEWERSTRKILRWCNKSEFWEAVRI